MEQHESPNPAIETGDEPRDDAQKELSRILKGFRHTPMGCMATGRDGVLRSLTEDRDVIDAVALSPRLLKAMLDRLPYDPKIEDIYRGVDGTGVPQEQWFHPDKDMLPPPLTEEQKAHSRKMMEDNKDVLREREEKIAKGEFQSCPLVLRANYNLDPKPIEDEEKAAGEGC